MYGTVFINSLLDNVNFSNTDFSPNAYESPFVYYSLYVDDIKIDREKYKVYISDNLHNYENKDIPAFLWGASLPH